MSFTQTGDASEVPFEVRFDGLLDPSTGVDVAVLELSRAVEGTACLMLSRESVAARPTWETFGHPAVIGHAPLRLGGTVDGSLVPYAGTGAQLLSLTVEGGSAPIDGMSGAPILTDRGVVGILNCQLKRAGEDGASAIPVFSKAFALPISRLQSISAFVRAIAGASRVFIAYRRNSRETELAKKLQRTLAEAGHDAFVDLDIQVGEDWAQRIRSTLERADAFIPVLTPESIESAMLLQEVRNAYGQYRQTGRPILLPIRDPAVEALPFEFDTYLGHLQYASWSGEADTSTAVRAIVSAVNTRILPAAPHVDDSPVSRAPADFVRLRPSATALPLDDPFYVERPADVQAYDRLKSAKSVLTILSPSGFGKTSLALRLGQRCKEQGRPVLHIDFRRFGRLPEDGAENRGLVSFLTEFARAFCRGLKLPFPTQSFESPPDVESVLYAALDFPRLVIVLDGVDRLIQRPYAEDFFRAIRSWAESTDFTHSFVLCIATEPSDLMTNLDVSPFNVDQGPVKLLAFEPRHLGELARRASVELEDYQIDLLHKVTGGHPVLTRQALAHVFAPGSRGPDAAPTAEEVRARIGYVHEQCGSFDGPFAASLKALLSAIEGARPLREDAPTLLAVLRKIIKRSKLTPAESKLAHVLVTFGLVRFIGAPAPGKFEALSLAIAHFFASLS